jgi:hypothetical protein
MATDKPGYTSWKAEYCNDLIKQVRPKIVDSSAAGDGLGFPCICWRVRSMTVEMCFEFDDAAESVGFDEFGEGEVVGVPTAVYTNTSEIRL